MQQTKFRGYQPAGSGEEDFEGFHQIWAYSPFWSCDQHHGYKFFIFMYLIAYIQNLVKNDPVVSEKSKFQFSNVNDLGPRSRN